LNERQEKYPEKVLLQPSSRREPTVNYVNLNGSAAYLQSLDSSGSVTIEQIYLGIWFDIDNEFGKGGHQSTTAQITYIEGSSLQTYVVLFVDGL
jgi:hypothetical protein